MNNSETEVRRGSRFSKSQKALFYMGLFALLGGFFIISFYSIKFLYHKIETKRLFRDNPVIVISEVGIKAPILEGTDNKVLSKSAGHFKGTGDIGIGNYCVAGHSSIIYDEYFNNLKNVDLGMEISLYDNKNHMYSYIISDKFLVNPNESWVLNDFNDNRITIITCTDDGSQRLVVVGKLSN